MNRQPHLRVIVVAVFFFSLSRLSVFFFPHVRLQNNSRSLYFTLAPFFFFLWTSSIHIIYDDVRRRPSKGLRAADMSILVSRRGLRGLEVSSPGQRQALPRQTRGERGEGCSPFHHNPPETSDSSRQKRGDFSFQSHFDTVNLESGNGISLH